MTQQITLKDCREKVLKLQGEGQPFHFYYKHLIGEEESTEKQYIYIEDFDGALIDQQRYSSLFFRTGPENN